MNLIIDHHQKISQVQENFQRHFPFLKIEFYSKAHDTNEPSDKYHQLHRDVVIGEAQLHPKDGVIHITPEIKVAELEKTFHDIFELNIQVFRLSGKVWLQTTSTDYKTLAEQNKMAMEMSKPVTDKVETPDIHEQE